MCVMPLAEFLSFCFFSSTIFFYRQNFPYLEKLFFSIYELVFYCKMIACSDPCLYFLVLTRQVTFCFFLSLELISFSFAALSEKLTEEVQRLKMVIGETSSRSSSSRESNISKTTLSPEMFQQLSISQQQMQHSKAQIK